MSSCIKSPGTAFGLSQYDTNRQGTITDFWFEPADGWKPGPTNPEKERMKEMCAPVYEWVKSIK